MLTSSASYVNCIFISMLSLTIKMRIMKALNKLRFIFSICCVIFANLIQLNTRNCTLYFPISASIFIYVL